MRRIDHDIKNGNTTTFVAGHEALADNHFQLWSKLGAQGIALMRFAWIDNAIHDLLTVAAFGRADDKAAWFAQGQGLIHGIGVIYRIRNDNIRVNAVSFAQATVEIGNINRDTALNKCRFIILKEKFNRILDCENALFKMFVYEVKNCRDCRGFSFTRRAADQNKPVRLRENFPDPFRKTKIFKLVKLLRKNAHRQSKPPLIKKNRKANPPDIGHIFGIGYLTLFAENFARFGWTGFENDFFYLIFSQNQVFKLEQQTVNPIKNRLIRKNMNVWAIFAHNLMTYFKQFRHRQPRSYNFQPNRQNSTNISPQPLRFFEAIR